MNGIEVMTIEDRIKKLREVHSIQHDAGNWNYDPYMHGMANGLELALGILEDREPNYKEAPAKWLAKDLAG